MGYPSTYEDVLNRAIESAFLARRVNPPAEITAAIKAELNEYLLAHDLSLNQAYREVAELKATLSSTCHLNEQLEARAATFEASIRRLKNDLARLEGMAHKYQLEASETKGRLASEQLRTRQLSKRLAAAELAVAERNQLRDRLAECTQEIEALHKLTMDRLVGR